MLLRSSKLLSRRFYGFNRNSAHNNVHFYIAQSVPFDAEGQGVLKNDCVLLQCNACSKGFTLTLYDVDKVGTTPFSFKLEIVNKVRKLF